MVTWLGPDRAGTRRRARSVLALAAIGYGVAATSGDFGRHGRGLVAAVLLAITVTGWLWLLFEVGGARSAVPAGLLVCGLAGTALTIAAPHSPAIAILSVAVVRAAVAWRPAWSVAFAFVIAVGYLVGHLGDTSGWLFAGPAVVVTALLVGFVRRQNDELAAQAQCSRDERARAGALDERARIAREIHDVLAHSIAALSVQLETADALLDAGRADQAHASVRRAGQLAKEGLAETRRAIGALRGDTLPLPDLLDALAAAYRADLDAPATVEVTGDRHELRADVSLTLYRTAQEAVTNVRKHAPGAPVDIALHYEPGEVTLAVTNGSAAPGVRPLASSGGGYGLTGLRERAELAGGTAGAGPAGAGWRVDVRIPV
jgi:signal transduction histidine kinase